ncbi:MAG: hypothetical protein Q8P65_00855 [bacterium]|nr:hypothetical protein [bacterium]
MLRKDFSIYLGKEIDEIFSGFIVEENFLLIIKIDNLVSKEKIREDLKDISTNILDQNIQNLNDFEYYLSSKWKEHNLPAEFSYAVGYLNGNNLYLKTSHLGQIFLKKGRDFAKIIEGENKASGIIEHGDFIVFTTSEFTKLLGGDQNLGNIFDHKNPHQILEEITPKLKSQDDKGVITLFLSFDKLEEASVISKDEEKNIEKKTEILKSNEILDKFIRLKEFILTNFKLKFQKRPITIFIIILLAFFLFWSLVSGYNRNNLKSAQLIKEKLKQADDVSDLNLSRSILLLADAKKDLASLKKKVNQNSKTVKDLEALIKEYENKILKSEEKNYTEFFDLSLEEKNINILQMYKNEDFVVILDKSQKAFVFSLKEKSIDTRKSSSITDVISIAYFNDDIFFLKKDGIYRLASDDKIKKIIANDKWGTVVDMAIFGGNIYILDSQKNDIYKFIPTESSFSEKISYFAKGQSINLEEAKSIAIDGSIFISFSESIVKFTSGLRDGFSTSYPNDNLKLAKIFTDEESNEIYAWSKEDGIIYVLSKNGSYEGQIKSSILKKATDFVVFEKSIYPVFGSKIYKIKL